MKKVYILIFTIFFLHVITSSSQILGKYGIKAGLVFNGISTGNDISVFTDSSAYLNFLAFDIGIYAELFNTKNFCVSTELHYLVRGEQNPNFIKILTRIPPAYLEIYEYKYLSDRFNYLSFQILPRYILNLTQRNKLFAFAGPRFELRIGNSNSGIDDDSKIFEMSNYKLETGGSIGFGGEMLDVFSFEFRYDYNFSNIYGLSYRNNIVYRKHNSLTFLLGLSLSKYLNKKQSK